MLKFVFVLTVQFIASMALTIPVGRYELRFSALSKILVHEVSLINLYIVG